MEDGEEERPGPGGAEPGGAEPRGAEPRGAEPRGAEPSGTEPGGSEPGGMSGSSVWEGSENRKWELVLEEEQMIPSSNRWSKSSLALESHHGKNAV